jgi:hypothetical protein
MNKFMKVFLGIFFVTLAVCLPNFSMAKTLTVPTEFGSIGSAISASNSGDIVLVSPGTYYENLSIRKRISVKSTSGYGSTIIDGSGKNSVVFFADLKQENGQVAEISGFTIRNGSSLEGRGGGVTLYGADVIIENNRIINNHSAMDGGGILLNESSNATIRDNIIESNASFRFGGAIFVVKNSNPLIYSNNISNNQSTGANYGGWGASGGAIYVDDYSSPQIIKNTIEYNTADFAGGGISLRKGSQAIISENAISYNDAAYGGGIHMETEGTSVRVIDNEIKNNTAWKKSEFSGSGYGGGVSVYNSTVAEIRDNRIHDNTGQSGGGGVVVSENAVATIKSNDIYKNKTIISADYHTGGAIYVANATSYIENNVIYSNQARIGGGIGLETLANVFIKNNTIVKNEQINSFSPQVGGGINVRSTVGTAQIINNIISQNTGFQIYEEYKKATIQNNLINDDGNGMYYNYNTSELHNIDSINTSGDINADSNISGTEDFVDSDDDDYSLGATSFSVNQGRNSGLAYDRSGNKRPTGASYDIGAFEYTIETNNRESVYRFWSDVSQRHFYTISSTERDLVFNNYPVVIWKYEGGAYQATPIDKCDGQKVHRFWSDAYQGHFYTMSESEKNLVISNYPDNIWKYEGEAFCAYSTNITGTAALYRFWSNKNSGHFYTASSSEKDYVINNYDDNIWKYESINFFVHPSR